MANVRAYHRGNEDLAQTNDDGDQCRFCGKTCNFKCGRCGEYYCSTKCQKDDWKEHRYVCFRMPTLVVASSGPYARGRTAETAFRTKHGNDNESFRNKPRQNVENNDLENVSSNNQRRTLESVRQKPKLSHQNMEVNKIPIKSDELSPYRRNRSPISSPKSNLNISSSSSSQSVQKKIPIVDEPKNNDKVVLTYIVNDTTCYIRSINNINEHIENSKDFNEYGKTAKTFSGMPQRDDICLVEYDKKFVRGIVVSSKGDNVKIGLPDIGAGITKSVNDIREISDELIDRKRSIFKMNYMEGGKGDELTMQYLNNCLSNETVFKLQFDGDSFSNSRKFNLNDLSLPTEEYPAKEDEEKSIVTKLATPAIKFETFPVGTLNVVVLDNTTVDQGYCSAIAVRNINKISHFHQKIQEIVESLTEVYEAEVNGFCLVKYDDEWYRAQCVEVRETDSDYILIDFGNDVTVNVNDTRKLPDELQQPCYTVFCHIEGLPGNIKNFDKYREIIKINRTLTDCEVIKKPHKTPGEDPEVWLRIPEVLDLLQSS